MKGLKESGALAASYALINKFNNASFKSSSRNQEDVYTSKSPNMRLNDSKKIIVNRKMISCSTIKSKGSNGDAKYYSVDANLKVGKKGNEHQPKQPRQKDSRADGKSRKASKN